MSDEARVKSMGDLRVEIDHLKGEVTQWQVHAMKLEENLWAVRAACGKKQALINDLYKEIERLKEIEFRMEGLEK